METYVGTRQAIDHRRRATANPAGRQLAVHELKHAETHTRLRGEAMAIRSTHRSPGHARCRRGKAENWQQSTRTASHRILSQKRLHLLRKATASVRVSADGPAVFLASYGPLGFARRWRPLLSRRSGIVLVGLEFVSRRRGRVDGGGGAFVE